MHSKKKKFKQFKVAFCDFFLSVKFLFGGKPN